MKITIGSVDYEVMIDENLGENQLGECHYKEQRILLNPALSKDIKEATFWHEVLHAILEQMGRKQDEKLVNELSYAITGVLKNVSFSLFERVCSQQQI